MKIRNIYRPKTEKKFTVQKSSTQRHHLNIFHQFSYPHLKIRIMGACIFFRSCSCAIYCSLIFNANVGTLLVQCWVNVVKLLSQRCYIVGPTLIHCWANVDLVLSQRVPNMLCIVKYFRAQHPVQNSCACNIKVVHVLIFTMHNKYSND